jgi:hypothetical protein
MEMKLLTRGTRVRVGVNAQATWSVEALAARRTHVFLAASRSTSCSWHARISAGRVLSHRRMAFVGIFGAGTAATTAT